MSPLFSHYKASQQDERQEDWPLRGDINRRLLRLGLFVDVSLAPGWNEPALLRVGRGVCYEECDASGLARHLRILLEDPDQDRQTGNIDLTFLARVCPVVDVLRTLWQGLRDVDLPEMLPDGLGHSGLHVEMHPEVAGQHLIMERLRLATAVANWELDRLQQQHATVCEQSTAANRPQICQTEPRRQR